MPISAFPVNTRMVSSFSMRSHASRRAGEGVVDTACGGTAADRSCGTMAESARLKPISRPPVPLTNSRRDSGSLAAMIMRSSARR